MTRDIRIGLALGSGGARGLAHAGVLDVLEDAGLVPDVIAGTSMGAIVGALYAETVDARETWRRLKLFAEDEEFLRTWLPFIPPGSGEDEPLGRIQGLMTSLQRRYLQVKTMAAASLTDAEHLRRPLRTMLRSREFAELELPFAAVGIDLISGEKVVFREGDLIEGVYASAAVPGVFPPVERDGKQIVDAGAPFRVPVNTCRELGADVVIGITIPGFTSSRATYRTGLAMAQRCEALAAERLDAFVMGTVDAVVRPHVSGYHWADFRSAAEVRERGVEAAREALPAVREAVARAAAEKGGWRGRLRRLFA